MFTLALATALLTPVPQDDATKIDDLFPPAQGALEIQLNADGEGPSYQTLLEEYAELTDQQVTFSEDTRTLLRQKRVQLTRSMNVPADEVQTTFEHLLRQSDFCMQILKAEGVRVLQVTSLNTAARNSIRAHAEHLDADDLESAADHPAVLFSTVISLPNVDVRQLSNSMRTMITDANTQQLLPAGNSNSMVIIGFGDSVAQMGNALRLIDEAAAASVQRHKLQHEVITLKNADAKELSITIGRLMRLDGEGSRSLILSDARTNSLLITATAEEISDIERIVSALDA